MILNKTLYYRCWIVDIIDYLCTTIWKFENVLFLPVITIITIITMNAAIFKLFRPRISVFIQHVKLKSTIYALSSGKMFLYIIILMKIGLKTDLVCVFCISTLLFIIVYIIIYCIVYSEQFSLNE